MVKIPPFREIYPDGTMRYNMTQPQLDALNSTTRFTWLLCGTQFGKTVLLPEWMHKKICEHGDGDYIAGTTNFPLMDKKMLPAFDELFHSILKVGKYKNKGSSINFYNGKVRIIFFTAVEPGSIESATAISAVLDEVGQDKWKEETWVAVQSRLSIASDVTGLNAGEVLGATTLYNFGWLKYKVYDEWLKGNPVYRVIHADSIENPAFPAEEYIRQREIMASWKFDLRYRGRYSKPVGLIYDSFDTKICVLDRTKSPIRSDWIRYVGMDFGNDTAALFYAIDPNTGFFYLEKEYLATGKTTAEHVEALKEMSQGMNIIKITGGKGDPGDDGWRGDFSKAGWHVAQPSIRPVEVGISRVYAFHKLNKLFVFSDLEEYLREKQSYSYKLDENNKPTGDIENKQRYHLMDAERGILSEFNTVIEDRILQTARAY